MSTTSLAERARLEPATVRTELEQLYATHTVARAVAEQLGVGVATLKRVVAQLETAGHKVEAGRRRGNPSWQKSPANAGADGT